MVDWGHPNCCSSCTGPLHKFWLYTAEEFSMVCSDASNIPAWLLCLLAVRGFAAVWLRCYCFWGRSGCFGLCRSAWDNQDGSRLLLGFHKAVCELFVDLRRHQQRHDTRSLTIHPCSLAQLFCSLLHTLISRSGCPQSSTLEKIVALTFCSSTHHMPLKHLLHMLHAVHLVFSLQLR